MVPGKQAVPLLPKFMSSDSMRRRNGSCQGPLVLADNGRRLGLKILALQQSLRCGCLLPLNRWWRTNAADLECCLG